MTDRTEGRFYFDETCSPEEERALRPYLARHQRLLPPWIDNVHVECKINGTGDEQCTAAIQTHAEYRRARLTIFSLWLSEPPEKREQAIVHELMHLYTNGQRVFIKDMVLLTTAENASLRDYLEEQLRKVNESTTEDLTLLLSRLGYYNHTPIPQEG